MIEYIHSSSLALSLSLTYFEQPAKRYQESTSNLWTIGVWEIFLSSFIFPSKPTDPRRNKLDIFNSCFDFSILIPVLTTASQFLLWHSASLFLLNSTAVFFFLQLTAQEFLSLQAVIKTSKLKTINIFVNSFVLPFNITRGNRTLQPQLPFLDKW